MLAGFDTDLQWENAHPDYKWLDKAKCRLDGKETSFFFVRRGDRTLERVAEVRAYCKPCPVTKECLEWALDAGCESGMFGGKTGQEIRKIRRQRKIGLPVPSGNRDKTHCKFGHPYDEMNTYNRPNGSRQCRICHKERNLEYRERKGLR